MNKPCIQPPSSLFLDRDYDNFLNPVNHNSMYAVPATYINVCNLQFTSQFELTSRQYNCLLPRSAIFPIHSMSLAYISH